MLEIELAPNALSVSGTSLRRPQDSARVLHEIIGRSDREHFVALYLNGRHSITHAHIASRGSLGSAIVHPREVFKGAFLANAAAVIVGHNHPSGDVTPSVEDEEVFERLRDAGKLLGVALLDALVVSHGLRYHSHSNGKAATLEPLSEAAELGPSPT